MLAAAACAAGSASGGVAPAASPATPPAPLAPAGGTATEGFRLGPGTLRYAVHQRVHIEQDFQGLPPALDLGYQVFLRATIQAPPPGASPGLATTLTLDSIVPDSGVILPPTMNLAAARGLTFSGRLAPTGELTDAVPSDSAAAQHLGQLLTRLRSFYPRLPTQGLKLGVQWTDTVWTTDRGGGGEVTTKSVVHSRAAAWEDRTGARALRLEVTATFELAGGGSGGGQPFSLAGSGTRRGTDYVAADGRYLGGESRDSTSLVITLPTQGIAIPRQQLSRLTVTVLP